MLEGSVHVDSFRELLLMSFSSTVGSFDEIFDASTLPNFKQQCIFQTFSSTHFLSDNCIPLRVCCAQLLVILFQRSYQFKSSVKLQGCASICCVQHRISTGGNPQKSKSSFNDEIEFSSCLCIQHIVQHVQTVWWCTILSSQSSRQITQFFKLWHKPEFAIGFAFLIVNICVGK